MDNIKLFSNINGKVSDYCIKLITDKYLKVVLNKMKPHCNKYYITCMDIPCSDQLLTMNDINMFLHLKEVYTLLNKTSLPVYDNVFLNNIMEINQSDSNSIFKFEKKKKKKN
jgi:hypothetical protein